MIHSPCGFKVEEVEQILEIVFVHKKGHRISLPCMSHRLVIHLCLPPLPRVVCHTASISDKDNSAHVCIAVVTDLRYVDLVKMIQKLAEGLGTQLQQQKITLPMVHLQRERLRST